MPTYGQTSILGINDDLQANNPGYSFQFNAGTNGTLDSIHFYVDTIAGTLRCAIYGPSGSDTGGGVALLEDLGEHTVTTSAWNTVNSTTNPSLVDGQWYVIALKSSSAIGIRIASGSGSIMKTRYKFTPEADASTDPWDDPSVTPSNTASWDASVYVTYTATAGAGQVVVSAFSDIQ